MTQYTRKPYKVVNGTIFKKKIGETVMLTDELAKAYWPKYVKAIRTTKKPKQQTTKAKQPAANATNKAVSSAKNT